MGGSPAFRARRVFKFADVLMVIATCAVAVAAVVLPSQPSSPAPIAGHLTEAKFIAAKCDALEALIGSRTDPTAVSAWTRREHVDAQACPVLLARRTVRR